MTTRLAWLTLLFASLGLLILGIFGLGRSGRNYPSPTFPQNNTRGLSPGTVTSPLSAEQKAGQLLFLGYYGDSRDDYLWQLLNSTGVGGVVLMSRYWGNPETLKTEISRIHATASVSGLPVLVAVDQEGGGVDHVFTDNTREFTPQSQITSSSQAYAVAASRGAELRRLGIDLVFSPVADLAPSWPAYLSSRAFHRPQEAYPELLRAMIKGYLSAGIFPVLKHFPGYGSTPLDPHWRQVVISPDELNTQINIYHGLLSGTDVPAIMTAHIRDNPSATLPASLSADYVEKTLRGQLEYDGVVITDDLTMRSATDRPENIASATLTAITAGNDIALVVGIPDEQQAAYQAILTAIRSRALTPTRAGTSLNRILRLKYDLVRPTP